MPKKAIQLSDHFTYSRLLRFVLPCIGTMLFTSIYGIVDGLCVSNLWAKRPLRRSTSSCRCAAAGTVGLCWAPAAAPS